MPKATLISPVSKQGIQLIRVAAYCRVSSSSADQINSYATQIDYYTKLAKKKKAEWNLIEIFADEGISGMKAKNRPEFQRMVKDSAKKGFDVVIVWKLDRFSRNRYDSAKYKAMLRKNDVKVVSATESISDGVEGIILKSVLEGMAEYVPQKRRWRVHYRHHRRSEREGHTHFQRKPLQQKLSCSYFC